MSLLINKLVITLLLASFAVAQNPDLIIDLPGLNESASFKQYAGYLTVDASHGRKLFYWFVESQNNPAKDPLVLWLNGGPGCSSLIGFLSENGPFRPVADSNGKYLKKDMNSWNRVANMLYLEAPAGVGFSYSNDINDYNTDDNKTANDNYKALQLWFKKYPQFTTNDFYVSGESYGGHYVPTLVNNILDGNKNSGNLHINLVGFLVGNGLTDNDIDLNAFMDVYAFHNIIPFQLYLQIVSVCNGNYLVNNNAQCNKLVGQAISYTSHLDGYDIYAPICDISNNNTITIKNKYEPVLFDHPLRDYPVGPKFDPCIDLHLTEYLNREDVRKAIHADKEAGEWVECTNKINYNFSMANAPSMIPLYNKFFKEAKLRILVYSGDVDSILPALGTQKWIATLDLQITNPWRPWFTGDADNQQVGGYVQNYDKLNYITIHGAGHMVPYYRPGPAYTFFSRFITQQPF